MSSFKNIPASERPRERLALLGEEALSLIEILAILLGSGTRGKNVLELARHIVESFPTLEALCDASVSDLLQVKGIGKAKAVQLKAALALAVRLQKEQGHKGLLDSPEKAAALIAGEVNQGQERLTVLSRNVRRELLHQEVVSIGTVSEVLLHPREIFHAAIRNRASSVIIAHNHPSGDPTPSKRDIEMTRAVEEAAGIVSIPLVDHLVIARRGFFSFRRQGLLTSKEGY